MIRRVQDQPLHLLVSFEHLFNDRLLVIDLTRAPLTYHVTASDKAGTKEVPEVFSNPQRLSLTSSLVNTSRQDFGLLATNAILSR